MCEKHREAISELVDPGKLAAIFSDKDYYEVEYLMERDGRQTWMRGELQLTARGGTTVCRRRIC